MNMTDFQRYQRILNVLSNEESSIETKARNLAEVLSAPNNTVNGMLIKSCQELMVAFSCVYSWLPNSSDATEPMFVKARRQLASALMHLVSPTWDES